MELVINETNSFLVFYNNLISPLSPFLQNMIGFFILVILFVIYALIIGYFYRFISKRNILELNLNQYNYFNHSFLIKTLATLFYIVEFIFIMPVIILIAFAVFTELLIVLTSDIQILHILMISGITIGAIRVASYIDEDISQQIAKIIPLTLLSISILSPNSLLHSQSGAKAISHLSQIPEMLSYIWYYFIFIFIIEILVRLLYSFGLLFKSEKKHPYLNTHPQKSD